MSITLKKNGGFPSLFSDFFGTSLIDRDFFDVGSDLFPSRLGINVPTANITENPKAYTLELAAPGLERKDFTVALDNHVLTVSAEKEEGKKENTDEYSRREYSFNSFSRSFTLPDNVSEGGIDAKYENGVLRVSIPKEKESSPRAAHRIQVS